MWFAIMAVVLCVCKTEDSSAPPPLAYLEEKVRRLRKALDTATGEFAIVVSIQPVSKVAGLPFTFPYTAEAVQDSLQKAFGMLRFSP